MSITKMNMAKPASVMIAAKQNLNAGHDITFSNLSNGLGILVLTRDGFLFAHDTNEETLEEIEDALKAFKLHEDNVKEIYILGVISKLKDKPVEGFDTKYKISNVLAQILGDASPKKFFDITKYKSNEQAISINVNNKESGPLKFSVKVINANNGIELYTIKTHEFDIIPSFIHTTKKVNSFTRLSKLFVTKKFTPGKFTPGQSVQRILLPPAGQKNLAAEAVSEQTAVKEQNNKGQDK